MGSVVGSQGGVSGTRASNLGGYISYNGYTFYSPMFRSELNLVPEDSADHRTTLCNTYELFVRALITDTGATGNGAFTGGYGLSTIQQSARGELQKARSCLTKRGGRLIIKNLGLDIDLNPGADYSVTSNLFDTRWGPTTKRLRIKPVGNGIVWEVEWICQFSLPECVSSGSGDPGFTGGSGSSFIGFPLGQGDLEGLTFETIYTINEDGLTQRVVRGHLSVALARASATGQGEYNKITATADELREMISPTIPLHFRRIRQEYPLSADKRILGFLIVDEELPGENEYPAGVTHLSLNHSVSISGTMLPIIKFIKCRFDGTLTTAKGYAHSDAFRKVLLIMQQRMDYARWVYLTNLDEAAEVNNPILITDVFVSEQMYGPRTLSFSIDYMIMAPDDASFFGNLIGRSGLFLPVNGSEILDTPFDGNLMTQIVDGVSDQAWADSMIGLNVWGQRGSAGLVFEADNDAIVGPCEGNGGTALDQPQYPQAVSASGGSISTDCPTTAGSYLFYDSDLSIQVDNKSAVHTPMKPPGTTPSQYGSVYTDDNAQIAPSIRTKGGNDVPSHVGSFMSSGAVVKIILRGKALRFAAPPEIPSINIQKFHALCDEGRMVPGDADVDYGRGGKIAGCPVYKATWEVEYTLTSLDKDVDIAAIIEGINQSVVTNSDQSGSKVGGSNTPDDFTPPTPIDP